MSADAFESLMRRLSGGDRSAMGELVDREGPALRRYLDARVPERLRRRVGVSDLMQETALKLFAGAAGVENRGPDAFRQLVFHAADQVLANALKREHREKRDVLREVPLAPPPNGQDTSRNNEPPGPARTPSGIAVVFEKIRAVQECFRQLTPEHRRIVLLVEKEQRSYDDIAGELGIAPETARKRYSRAMERLRKLLDEAGVSRG